MRRDREPVHRLASKILRYRRLNPALAIVRQAHKPDRFLLHEALYYCLEIHCHRAGVMHTSARRPDHTRSLCGPYASYRMDDFWPIDVKNATG